MPEEIKNPELQYPNSNQNNNLENTSITSQGNKVSSKRNKTIFIVIIVFLILSLLFILSAFLALKLKNSSGSLNLESEGPEEHLGLEQEISNYENLFPVPELYPKAEWNVFKEGAGEESLGTYALYFLKDMSEPINLTGNEWISTVMSQTVDEKYDLISDFQNYYNSSLKELGWNNKYEDDKFEFMPIAADGPTGSMWGYLKAKNGMLRVIVLSYEVVLKPDSNKLECPCDLELKVFVSDVGRMSDLAGKVGKL